MEKNFAHRGPWIQNRGLFLYTGPTKAGKESTYYIFFPPEICLKVNSGLGEHSARVRITFIVGFTCDASALKSHSKAIHLTEHENKHSFWNSQF